jgi:hypothetical protein
MSDSHWDSTVTSTVGGASQYAAMGPSLSTGTRKRFTILDFAGMDDLGWDLAVPGDANADGIVDIVDLGIVGTNWQVSGELRWAQGDFNYDRIVDIADLGAIGTNWQYGTGQNPPDQSSFAQALSAYPDLTATLVPEPATAVLLLPAIFCLTSARRRITRTASQ